MPHQGSALVLLLTTVVAKSVLASGSPSRASISAPMVTPLAHCSGTGRLKTEAGERRSAKSARALAVERSLQGEALWCVFLCDLKTSHLCPLSEVHPHVFCFL